jgi:hypothetical protein
VQGGAPVTASMSNATRTASIPAALTSATTSSSDLAAHSLPQYFPSASTYGPWDVIHSCVPG